MITEETGDLEENNENEMAMAFENSSMPLIYCINQNFQNFDENDEEEIPPVLQRLIDQELERFVKPLVDEITAVNVGTKQDPRLV